LKIAPHTSSVSPSTARENSWLTSADVAVDGDLCGPYPGGAVCGGACCTTPPSPPSMPSISNGLMPKSMPTMTRMISAPPPMCMPPIGKPPPPPPSGAPCVRSSTFSLRR